MTQVQFLTVAQSIADIDLSAKGIRTKQPDEIPVNGITECPYFAPRPDNFISNIQHSRMAFGSGGAEPMNLTYTMTWQYFHAPVGQLLTFQKYSEMLENLAYILEQMADNDSTEGAVDVTILGIPSIAQLMDVKGNLYHGAEISLQITEFIK